jgi:23S rRNA pseudouridine1911/1915/1917 synthase
MASEIGREPHRARIIATSLACVEPDLGTIVSADEHIGRNGTQRKLMSIVPLEKGRTAVSEYRTLESFPNHTLLEVHPLTGRTHQIRVHLAFLGCPVTGDTIYGKKKPSVALDRHFLHAYKLKIIVPGEKLPRLFEAALPVELDSILKFLRNQK